MDKTLWRVYRVERGEDVGKALALFEVRMGKRPKRARVSARAAAGVVEALKAAGLEVEVMEGQIASDVWLTDGAVVTEQLALFGDER
jgi:hypothetical protein